MNSQVREIVKQAVGKNLDIPEFQREFVWDPEQVKLLAESLYRDYPVGSFLLWDSSEYQEAKTAQGTQASLWIVDGQQRTTALCLLMGMKPFWWPDAQDWNKALDRYDVMVNLSPDQADDRLEFALPNPIRRRDPGWIAIRRILSTENVERLTPIAHEIARHLGNSPEEMMEKSFGKVHARLQRLWQIRERDIPIVHALANITVLNERTNANKLAGKEPWRYIQQFRISSKALRAHLIPNCFAEEKESRLGKRWAIDGYDNFLIDRAALLAQEANALLRKLAE